MEKTYNIIILKQLPEQWIPLHSVFMTEVEIQPILEELKKEKDED